MWSVESDVIQSTKRQHYCIKKLATVWRLSPRVLSLSLHACMQPRAPSVLPCARRCSRVYRRGRFLVNSVGLGVNGQQNTTSWGRSSAFWEYNDRLCTGVDLFRCKSLHVEKTNCCEIVRRLRTVNAERHSRISSGVTMTVRRRFCLAIAKSVLTSPCKNVEVMKVSTLT